MPGAVVKIGGIEATSVGFVNNTKLTALTPPGTTGARDIVVINPDGQSATLSEGFTYTDVSKQANILNGINLFNPDRGGRGEISYRLDKTELVTVVIYDRFGNEVITLVNENRAASTYVDKWDGRNASGAVVASGYYNVLLKTGGDTRKLKLVVMK
jgi:hypothetical protein